VRIVLTTRADHARSLATDLLGPTLTTEVRLRNR